MSLILDIKEMQARLDRLAAKAGEQQHTYHAIISGVVALHQKHRVAKNYVVSDDLRTTLNNAGVTIIQGTDGYEYDDIPAALKGRTVDDTWEISPVPGRKPESNA